MKNPVVHFEMPAADSKRMADFYTKAFGWETKSLGEEMNNYTLVTTSETDSEGMVKTPGTINGGFYPKNNNEAAQHPSLVIAVEDINQAMKDIRDAGGQIIGEPVEIPGYGINVSFYDTEGNRVSLMEPFMNKR